MKIKVIDTSQYTPRGISARCPHCGHDATFEPLGVNDVHVGNSVVTGQRSCPRSECKGHIFTVTHGGQLRASYPPITLDFNSTNIPQNIKKTFEEALKCHSSGSFVSSAMMVRRTLEEICKDKGASGANLKLRIADLKSKIVLPQELIEAMDELRLLGNDAAHVEAQDYENIGDEELTAAIDLTKEIMKGIYQYSAILGRLKALKAQGKK